MAKLIEAAELEVLVEVVRFVQKQDLRGSEGSWKDFLTSHDKQLGADLSDPAKRSKELLVSFLKTFSQEFQRYFGKIIRRQKDRYHYKKHLSGLTSKSSEQQLVGITLDHPEYMKNYTFPSYKEGWKVMRLGKFAEVVKSKSLISIDCEMVECQDGSDAIVRVCAVDRNLEVKLDTLVKPIETVSNYRTHITGLSAKDLEGVECTLADVQKLLKELLPRGTILVGHSLHFDLRALKLDYPLVIDTSAIFKCNNLRPGASPSLNNLCKAVLGYAVREEGQPHNCLRDAEAAMKLVLTKLEKGFEDSITIVNEASISESDLAKLLVHRVPVDFPLKELVKIFPTVPVLDKIDDKENLRVRGGLYAAYVEFNSAAEADGVFRQLDGQENKDSSGRPQKFVTLKHNGKYIRICVRKMAPGKTDLLRKRLELRPSSESNLCQQQHDDSGSRKRQRTCQHCDCDEEIERLKKQIEQRDDEIFRLQKLIASAPDVIG